ncbi:MAG: DUF2993 domain-containing protein [Elainella sp.]
MGLVQATQAAQPDLGEPLTDSPPDVSDPNAASGSRLISRILSPAIRLWLRVQLEAAATLSFQVGGSDRQILKGYIPTVEVVACQAVYRGLHLSQAQLTANQIRINLGQVVQGKPLRLLEPVPVTGRVCISQTDLTASLAAPLLLQALREVWQLLLQRTSDARLVPLRSGDAQLHSAQIVLAAERLVLTSEMAAADQIWHLSLQTTPQLRSPNCLELADLELQVIPADRLDQPDSLTAAPPWVLAPLHLDLGRDVHLEELVIEAAQIVCRGQIVVNP